MRFMYILFYLCSSLLYYDYTNTHFFPSIFVESLTPGEGSSVSIFHKYLIHKRTINHMNVVGKGF